MTSRVDSRNSDISSKLTDRVPNRLPTRPRDGDRAPSSRTYTPQVSGGRSTNGSESGSTREYSRRRDTSPSTIVNKKTNDPAAGPARRARASPWPRITVEEALRRISKNVTPLSPTTVKFVDVTNDLDYTLAADVRAQISGPAFRTSMVDGYALRLGTSEDPRGAKFSVVSTPDIPMRIKLDRGQVARVSTGQSLSSDVDAIVMVEDTAVVDAISGGREEARIKIFDDAPDIRPGDNIREVGSDFRRGDTILRKGDFVSAAGGELSLICAAGVESLTVYPQPRLTVIDINPNHATKDSEGTPSSNKCLVQALLSESGIAGSRPDWGAVLPTRANAEFKAPRNNPRDVADAFESALKSDIIITTGGVSMGEDDLIKPIIERTFRGKIHFGRVDMKPGMPTTFATIRGPKPSDHDRLVFCLPEHPASIIAAFSVLVMPALHRLTGKLPRDCGFPRIPVLLEGRDVRAHHTRTSFHRATVVARPDGRLHATSSGEQGLPVVTPRNIGANALLCIPPGDDLRAGNEVLALITRPFLSDVMFSTVPATEEPTGEDKYWPS